MLKANALRAGAFLVTVVSLQGCESRDPNDPGQFKAEWSTLDDGSSYTTKSDDKGEFSAAWRCWKSESGGYDCLGAGQGPMGSISVAREHNDELPTILLPMVDGNVGYSCGSLLGKTTETIAGPDGDLISNHSAPRWGRRFVQDYMAKNHVKGQHWFPCLTVLDRVSEGSLATMRTTTVTPDMLGSI